MNDPAFRVRSRVRILEKLSAIVAECEAIADADPAADRAGVLDLACVVKAAGLAFGLARDGGPSVADESPTRWLASFANTARGYLKAHSDVSFPEDPWRLCEQPLGCCAGRAGALPRCVDGGPATPRASSAPGSSARHHGANVCAELAEACVWRWVLGEAAGLPAWWVRRTYHPLQYSGGVEREDRQERFDEAMMLLALAQTWVSSLPKTDKGTVVVQRLVGGRALRAEATAAALASLASMLIEGVYGVGGVRSGTLVRVRQYARSSRPRVEDVVVEISAALVRADTTPFNGAERVILAFLRSIGVTSPRPDSWLKDVPDELLGWRRSPARRVSDEILVREGRKARWR